MGTTLSNIDGTKCTVVSLGCIGHMKMYTYDNVRFERFDCCGMPCCGKLTVLTPTKHVFS